MSANPGRNGLNAGYSSDQMAVAMALRDSLTPAGSKARPGRGRSSAPSPATSSGRGRSGYATPSTRPPPSAVPTQSPLQSFSSTASSRTTHAPGATKSGVINPHFATFSVGASTAAPTFKSPPRQRPVSPVRTLGAPASVPAVKTSPPKLRSSILVVDSAPRVISSGDNASGQIGQSDPQSDSFNASIQASALANNSPVPGGWTHTQVPYEVDPRFMAVQSSHPMHQQPAGAFFSIQGQNLAAQEHNRMPSNAPLPVKQGQGTIADGQAKSAVPNDGRVRITTNWTDEDPSKPIIPGHLRQPDGEKVIVEIADKVGVPASNCHGVMTVGISNSIHAPGNAQGNSYAERSHSNHYQASISDTAWMSAAADRNHKTVSNRIPSGDCDVEMSDVQASTRTSVPQGPVEWDKLPTLAASKYASPSAFSGNPHNSPQPAPTSNICNENIKPTQQHVPAQGFGVLGHVNKSIVPDPTKNLGFNGAPGQTMFNPFVADGGQADQNSTQVSGFGAAAVHSAGFNPFMANSAGHTSAQSNAPAKNSSDAFGAPSAAPVGGPVHQFVSSRPNGPNSFSDGNFGASVQAHPQVQPSQTDNNCFGTQAKVAWGTGAQPAYNGQPGASSSGFDSSRNGSADQFSTNASHGGSFGNDRAGQNFGTPQSQSMGQSNPFMTNGRGNPSEPTLVRHGEYNNPFILNSGPPTQNPSNAQPVKVTAQGRFDVAKVAASIDNDIRRMYVGKAAGPAYEASPFGPPVNRSTVISNASGSHQPGSGPPAYQVVPESKKDSGLAASRWA